MTDEGERNVDMLIRDLHQPGPYDIVRIAVEHKTLMTAHGKARKNRKGDLIAAAIHNHSHSMKTIVAPTMVVNTSQAYLNPDPRQREVARDSRDAASWRTFLEQTLALYTGLKLREDPMDPANRPEAVALILVNYDGEHPARLVTEPPAPQPGEPGHVLPFYERIIRLYQQRF